MEQIQIIDSKNHVGETVTIGAWVANKRSSGKIAFQSTSNPTAVSQYAAVEALKGEQDTVEEMRNAFEERLNTLYPLVAELPGVTLEKPQGAFYLFPNVKETLRMCKYENVTKC